MNNINVKVVGSANLTQMTGSFGKFEAQVAALNAQLAKTVALSQGVDPVGYQNMVKAAQDNTKAWRAAVDSTGMFERQQLRVNSATDTYIKKLQKQELSFSKLVKQRKVAAAAYQEQLRMENMAIRQSMPGSANGKQLLDVTTPRAVSAEIDTAGKRMAFFNEQVRSGAHQMVNWGKNTQWAGRQLTVGLTMPMAALGAAAGVMAYQVDKELTRVAKVYDATADAMATSTEGQMAYQQEMDQLRQDGTNTAIKAAKEYGVSAKDTLNIQAELAAVGKKGAELQKTTNDVMRIARLGEIDYQVALESTISLQSVFRLSAEETAEAFDYMNSVENATSLATADFAAAIPIAAAPIKAFGGDVQELGVLLTAMKERGIGATEGANALKSAMQRLGRPSKQIQEEFKALTGEEIIPLVDGADSLSEVFTRLNGVTEDMAAKDKRKVFAGLFGSYQVTRLGAVVDGMGDLEKGIGQVSDAYNISKQDPSDWAAVADQEMKAYQKSISGQFDSALATVQAQLATLGEPFVKLATIALKGVSMVIDAFNGLPAVAKYGIAIALALGTIAGPALMLVGLFANLAGNGLKLLTTFAGINPALKTQTAEQRAAAMAAGLATSEYLEERTAVQQLQVELNKLTLAQARANEMTFGAVPSSSSRTSAAAAAAAALRAEAQATSMGQTGPGVIPVQTNPFAAAVDDDKLKKQDQLNAALKTETAEREKQSRSMKGAAVATGAMAASSIAMMLPLGETGNSIAQFALLASIAVPAVQMMVPLLKSSAAWTGKTATGLVATASAARAGSTGIAGMAVAARAAGVAFATMLGPIGLITTAVAAIGFAIWKWHSNQENAIEENLDRQKLLNSAAETYAQAVGKSYEEWKKIESVSVGPAASTQFDDAKNYYTDNEEGKKTADEFGDMDAVQQERFAIQQYVELVQQAGMSSKEASASVAALWAAGSGKSAYEANRLAEEISSEYGNIKDMNFDDFGRAIENARAMMDDAIGGTAIDWIDTEDLEDIMATEAPKIAGLFSQAFADAKSPQEKISLFNDLEDSALQSWNDIYSHYSNDGIMGPEFKAQMKKLGIDSGKEFSIWYRSLGEGASGEVDRIFGMMDPEMTNQLKNANAVEKAIIGQIAEYNNLGSEITTVTELQRNFNIMAQLLSFKDAKKEVRSMMNDALAASNSFESVGQSLLTLGAKGPKEEMERLFATMDPEKVAEMEAAMNAFANEHNIKIGSTALKTYQNIMGNVKVGIDDSTSATKRGTEAVKDQADAWKATAEEASQVAQDAMSGVQQDIADMRMDTFDNQMESALDARQEMWDARSNALDKSIESRENSLSNTIEAREEALSNSIDKRTDALEKEFDQRERGLDVKWEKKNDQAEKYWDGRIEKINDAIEAEQKAEEKRQKMFDNEMARIDKLNDAMNTNIDFNVALNEGNFDEAAKIRNNVNAAAQQTALEAAAQAGSRGSARRVDALEGRVENVEEARDVFMKDLAKREEAERRHLAKVREIRERALDKWAEREEKALEEWSERQQNALQRQTEAEQAALERQEENDMQTQQNIWENRKESLQKQLDLFTSYIAKNEKDLKRHMKSVGLSYKDFGRDTLKPLGEDWSSFFGERMRFHIRQSGLKLASDKMWERLGEGSSRGILKGMGFDSMAQFTNFIKTGNMGGGAKGGPTPSGKPGGDRSGRKWMAPEMRHEGGMIGSGAGSRKGVARTAGLHSSEKMILAQKGEYVVNRKAAGANQEVLDSINNGKSLRPAGNASKSNIGRGTGGAGPMSAGGLISGPAAMMAGALAKTFAMGIGNKMQDVYSKKKKEMAALSGMYSAGKAGIYGDIGFSMSQLQHAATIASVGSKMGMSARDIQIGIMTAITESMLSLPDQAASDRDSAGLFQQRPSQGWGSVAQVMDPEYAASKFFQALKGVTDRGSMSPWMAAQTVQRSAYSSGSNYQQYWDEAQAIFGRGLTEMKNGGFSANGFREGSGGLHRPSVPGKGWRNSHDYANGENSPLYAYNNGRVIASKATTSGGSAGNGEYRDPISGRGYTSYGETITIAGDDGSTVLYAHLSPGKRFVRAGQRVKGGSLIGLSGSTGNSSGFHTHFTTNGTYNAQSFFADKGIPLKVGGTIKQDGTPAILHKNERVLTAPLTSKLDAGIEAIYRAAKEPKYKAETIKPGKGKVTDRDKEDKSKSKFKYPKLGTGMADSPYTWMETSLLKKDKPKKIPAATPSTTGGRINFGAYNAAGGIGNAASNVVQDFKSIRSKVDVLAMSEDRQGWTRFAADMRKAGWGYHHGKGGDTGVAWNKDKYKAVKTGTRDMADSIDKSGKQNISRSSAYALMKDKEKGSQFWVVAAHTQATGGGRGPRANAINKVNLQQLGKLYEDLRKTGSPVFVAGDLNNRSPIQGGVGNGLRSGHGGIDHILYSGRDGQRVGGGATNNGMSSDHPFIWSKFNMGGKGGGKGGNKRGIPGLFKGTQNVKWDNTIANLHRGESVLTEDLTKKFKIGVDNFANGGGQSYNDIKIYASEGMDEEMLANKVLTKLDRRDARLPGSRKR